VSPKKSPKRVDRQRMNTDSDESAPPSPLKTSKFGQKLRNARNKSQAITGFKGAGLLKKSQQIKSRDLDD
jgi:hypothetical protein